MDAAGCQARDTIVVKEIDCQKGISFPNAFSPNSDGRNDTFKPEVNGNIEKFQFVIYNRYGEKVFESKNPRSGWDGKFRGRNQDNNVFVWYCMYKLNGEPEKIEKGTVILAR